jgi:hypothetical protein
MISQLIYSMFPPDNKKSVIIELSSFSHINYLRPHAAHSVRDQRRQLLQLPSKILRKNENARILSEEIYAPVYTSGSVLVPSLLNPVLFQILKNPSILETIKLICGNRTQRHDELDKMIGIRPSFLSQIHVPEEFYGRSYGELYSYLTLGKDIVPIALYRATNTDSLGNILPFVYTNPIYSLVLLHSDIVFVLSQS